VKAITAYLPNTMKISIRRIIQRALVLIALCVAQVGLAVGNDTKPLKVLASFYPMYVMTLNVVSDTPNVSVECMTEPITGCLHDYQLTPANLKTLVAADVFVANGAGMETFIEKAVKQSPHLQVIEASKGMKLAFDDNPHVWVSVSGAIQQTENIAKGLAAVDPAHAAAYQKNAANYVARLEALRQKMHTALDGLKYRDIITFHEAFPYFASEFNLRIVAVIEREPGSEPSAGELAQTIRTVKKSNVKALFAEPQYPAKSAQIIERETGVPVSILDPAVTGPRDPVQARNSYLRTMENNGKILQKALGD